MIANFRKNLIEQDGITIPFVHRHIRPLGRDSVSGIAILERRLGRKARLDLLPMQPGDVVSTMADVTALEEAVGFRPNTPLETGIARFVAWYNDYYGVMSPES